MSCTKTLDLSQAVSGAHLSYYWTMNEAGDATKLDSTVGQAWNTVAGSNSPPGLFVNGIELDDSAFFHGLNGPDSPAFAFNSVTSKGVSFWFWYKLLVYGQPGTSGSTQFSIECAATVPPNDSYLKIRIQGGTPFHSLLEHGDVVGSNFTDINFTLDPGIGVWHMFCGTLDLQAHTLNLYIDGVLTGSTPDAFPFWTADKGILILGDDQTFFGPPTTDVIVDEFGLSLKGALTQAQITALWNGGVGKTWPNITAIVPYP